MPTPTPIVTRGLDAMRTRFEVVLLGEDERHLTLVAESALAEVERLESTLSLFRRDSVLSHINRSAGTAPVPVDGETFGLLLLCRQVWERSGGLFDPTIAALMTTLGLHEHAAIEDAERLGRGFDAVVLDEVRRTVRFQRPVALDLGAVAKGFALDAAAAVVREGGVQAGLLHGGTSSVVAVGSPPGRDGWEVGIRTPGGGDRERVVLRDLALGVSAHHGRVVGGVGHVLDPRTGRSAEGVVKVAAVVAPSGALADAWSTAVLVGGGQPEGMPVGWECRVY